MLGSDGAEQTTDGSLKTENLPCDAVTRGVACGCESSVSEVTEIYTVRHGLRYGFLSL